MKPNNWLYEKTNKIDKPFARLIKKKRAQILFYFFNFIYLFLYLWLCWVFVSVWGLSPVAASGGHSSSRCAGLSLWQPLLLRSTSSRRAGSAVVAHGPSCSAACGILPDQGSNPCPPHWQADAQPLHHQGSPRAQILNITNKKSYNQHHRNTKDDKRWWWTIISQQIGQPRRNG